MATARTVALIVLVVFVVLVALEVSGRSAFSPVARTADLFTIPNVRAATSPA